VASGRLSRRRSLRPLTRADRRAISDAIDAVDLGHRTHDGISTLSGGQQQRALIARALAGEPEVLVLDEPTAGVDLPHQQSLAEVLHRLSDRGATVVLVAHELGPMRTLVDRAVVMRDGMVAYDGAPLSEQEAHAPHHVVLGHLPEHDHVPHIESPLETRPGEVAE
jgi:zinc transport system ATP-binding protein